MGLLFRSGSEEPRSGVSKDEARHWGLMVRDAQRRAPHHEGNIAGLPALARRLRMNGQRMHGTREFARQGRIYHAVAFDPALPFEGIRHNINPKMRFAAGAVARMALMQM